MIQKESHFTKHRAYPAFESSDRTELPCFNDKDILKTMIDIKLNAVRLSMRVCPFRLS